jgi:hypothetical protein
MIQFVSLLISHSPTLFFLPIQNLLPVRKIARGWEDGIGQKDDSRLAGWLIYPSGIFLRKRDDALKLSVSL